MRDVRSEARFRMRQVTPGLAAAMLAIAATMLGGTLWTEPLAARADGGGILARSVALYPTLRSYADTGTVVVEAPGIVDRFKFTTYFRQGASLDFFFDFQGVTSKSGPSLIDMSDHRIVLWMTAGELQTYNQSLRTHETIPRETGNQVAAVQNLGAATTGTATLIPSLIFAKANMSGAILQIQQPTDADFDAVSGRRCHKVIGIAAEYYPSGAMTNVRQVTVWVDAETLLVRQVFEDTPKGYPAGSYRRVTVAIDPKANPPLDDSKFQFKVPTLQQ